MGAVHGLATDDLLPAVAHQLGAPCDFLIERAEAGDEVYRRLVTEGHLDHCRSLLRPPHFGVETQPRVAAVARSPNARFGPITPSSGPRPRFFSLLRRDVG
jgi:hypothetical protein